MSARTITRIVAVAVVAGFADLILDPSPLVFF